MRMAIRHYEWNMTAAGASAALVLFMLYLFRRKTNLAELINCVTYGVPSKFSVCLDMLCYRATRLQKARCFLQYVTSNNSCNALHLSDCISEHLHAIYADRQLQLHYRIHSSLTQDKATSRNCCISVALRLAPFAIWSKTAVLSTRHLLAFPHSPSAAQINQQCW